MLSLRRGSRLPHCAFIKLENIRYVTGFGGGDTADHRIVPVWEARRFAEACVESVGVKESHGKLLAELLVAADTRGHYSHGLNRLGEKRKMCEFIT